MTKKTIRVVGCFIEHDGRFLIVHRKPGDGNCWALPAGGVEAGETDIQAMIRELHEEIGHTALEKDLELLTVFSVDTAEYIVDFVTYRLVAPHQIPFSPATDEHDDHRWTTPQEAYALDDVIEGFKELLLEIGYVKK